MTTDQSPGTKTRPVACPVSDDDRSQPVPCPNVPCSWACPVGPRAGWRRVVDGPMPIHNVIPMAKIARKTVSRRAASAAARFSATYKARSRTRIAKLVKAGRGEESFNDVALSLGIDLARGERARLVTVCGHKVG